VLFANNPMWRQETQGNFMLLVNAALNFDHLDVGGECLPSPLLNRPNFGYGSLNQYPRGGWGR
jgi:hypothetical protein